MKQDRRAFLFINLNERVFAFCPDRMKRIVTRTMKLLITDDLFFHERFRYGIAVHDGDVTALWPYIR